jgi:hypothetical protein
MFLLEEELQENMNGARDKNETEANKTLRMKTIMEEE